MKRSHVFSTETKIFKNPKQIFLCRPDKNFLQALVSTFRQKLNIAAATADTRGQKATEKKKLFAACWER